jgi:uncharacterized membrane protein (UPF0127 family)
LLEGILSKSKGLINSNTPKTVIFYTRFGIHTFGMKYPIDVIVIDKKFKVIAAKESIKPNRIFLWNLKGNRVIELANGVIKRSHTKINDFLEINL